ncbi:transposase InsO family protein [Sinorhizobium meliloti]
MPDVEGDKPAKKFKSYPIGYFHIDIAEVQTAEGKLYLFVAIDRALKFAYVELHAKAGKMAAAQFLRNLIAAVVDAIHRVLTDNGVQFTNSPIEPVTQMPSITSSIGSATRTASNIVLTKVKHPWTNGQGERVNRTIKDATVKRFHYHDQLRRQLDEFIAALQFGRRLKTLKGLTPYEFICKA